MSQSKMIELNNLTVNFERKIAISSLSFTVRKGELVALIGPSGAGKSTLLNTLTGINKPTSGEILIADTPLKNYKSSKQLAKKVGVIRQQFDLVGQLAVINNVLAGRLADWGFFNSLVSLISPRDKHLAVNALKRVGLENKLFQQTSSLSGGEQQRVAMARLLVQKPEIILADEPVSSLDPARADDILSMLTTLAHEEDLTLLASLHSVELAKKYFNRIIGLRDGKIHFDLDTNDVTDDILEKLYTIKEVNSYE
ncbi:MAG: phosphonate transporter ATP-binding protein [Bacillales bacterium]|jgi:phosphonate transport system ATP-binding protein|nr:phosphonate transporter ATP-binding protein [Bacillales bacterium]